jgi:LemA protein
MDLISWAIILLIVLIVVIILLTFWGIYNRIIRTENQIDNAWAQIDVQMKRRADLIPNLMETVRGYMKHERGTMESVTNARAAIMSAKTPQESNDANNMLTGALKTLFAVAENYPDLKANQNFLQLQDELTHTEDKIAYSRQHYNDSVLVYNNTIETFPGNFFAHRMGRKAREMLQIPEASKEVPKVSF